MKFPRNARIFRGQLDAAPFASVFFLLVMFMMMNGLVYTPGIPMQLELPYASGVEGTDKPTASVAVDANGRLYYQNQLTDTVELRRNLRALTEHSKEPMVLIVQADRRVTHETLVRLALFARNAGFVETRLATLPRPSIVKPAAGK